MGVSSGFSGVTLLLASIVAVTDASSAGEDLNTAFFYAVGNNDVAKAKVLLARGVDINARTRPWNLTAMLIAPDVSREMVQFLLEHGADVNAADREGTTVLMRVVHSGDPQMVALVLKYRPRLEAKGTWNNTALTYAVVQGNPEMVQRLIAAGADVNAERADGMRPLDMAQRRLTIAKSLPPKYGVSDSPPTEEMHTAMRGSAKMMHDVPRPVLIDKAEQVLALVQQAHAIPGSGKMASRDVVQHCGTKQHAM